MIEKTLEAKFITGLKKTLATAPITGFWQATTTGAIRQQPPLISVTVKPRFAALPTLPYLDFAVEIVVIVTPETDPLKTKLADWAAKVMAYCFTLNSTATAATELDATGHNVTGVDLLQGDAGYDSDDNIFYVVAPLTVHITV